MTKERQTEEKFAKESDTFRAYAGKKRMIFAVFTVILLALIAGIGIYNTPANRLARQIDLGRKYLEKENYEQAVIEFDKAIAIDPMSVDAYLGKADAYIAMGDVNMALQTLEEGYSRTGSESIKKRIEEISLQTAGEAELSRGPEEEDAEETADIIDFTFELSDITIMGYDLFTAHYEEVCAAYGCPIDTDSGRGRDLENSSVMNEYGDLQSDVSSEDGGEQKFLSFYQHTETVSYPAISYSNQISDNHMLVNISIYSSFDRVSDLESCKIHVPAPTGTYEDWCSMLPVQEIKANGTRQEQEGGEAYWEFPTKWGQARYMEGEGYARLEIYLNNWTVGENDYNGIFSIDRYVDFGGTGLGESWTYGMRCFTGHS